jgi:hypothetical protein
MVRVAKAHGFAGSFVPGREELFDLFRGRDEGLYATCARIPKS